jgi:hypothetical protein
MLFSSQAQRFTVPLEKGSPNGPSSLNVFPLITKCSNTMLNLHSGFVSVIEAVVFPLVNMQHILWEGRLRVLLRDQ